MRLRASLRLCVGLGLLGAAGCHGALGFGGKTSNPLASADARPASDATSSESPASHSGGTAPAAAKGLQVFFPPGELQVASGSLFFSTWVFGAAPNTEVHIRFNGGTIDGRIDQYGEYVCAGILLRATWTPDRSCSFPADKLASGTHKIEVQVGEAPPVARTFELVTVPGFGGKSVLAVKATPDVSRAYVQFEGVAQWIGVDASERPVVGFGWYQDGKLVKLETRAAWAPDSKDAEAPAWHMVPVVVPTPPGGDVDKPYELVIVSDSGRLLGGWRWADPSSKLASGVGVGMHGGAWGPLQVAFKPTAAMVAEVKDAAYKRAEEVLSEATDAFDEPTTCALVADATTYKDYLGLRAMTQNVIALKHSVLRADETLGDPLSTSQQKADAKRAKASALKMMAEQDRESGKVLAKMKASITRYSEGCMTKLLPAALPR